MNIISTKHCKEITMYEYLNLLLILTLGLISPGPDFIVVLKNTISYSKTYGIWTALGVALGTLVHLTYIAFGFGLLLQNNLFILNLLKYIGAFYLIYIGYKSFTNKENKNDVIKNDVQTISIYKAMLSGFITNAFNPKAAIFFIGIFAVILNKESNTQDLILYGTTIFLETLIWFCLVAIILSKKKIKNYFDNMRNVIDKIIGTVLVGFGIKLIFTKLSPEDSF